MQTTSLRLLLALFWLAVTLSVNASPTKILAIGNSFSEDAVEQDLHAVCKSQGDDVIIGNLYIASCNIDRHYTNISENRPAYRFRKIDVNGKMTQINNCRLSAALRSEKWDYIVFQQASEFSGIFSSYSKLPELMRLVRKIVGVNPVFAFHQTWAYASNSTHGGFRRYDRNQLTMYHEIVRASQLTLEKWPELKFVIPSGTAIQNARTALSAGDDLTRDGYHLDRQAGRYTASLTWYIAIFRRLLSPNVFKPAGVGKTEKEVCLDAATEAVLHPWRITPIKVYVDHHQ